IRRSRERVGISSKDTQDKENFYSTTYFVLANLAKIIAPIIPFLSEDIYKNLTGEESVHLANWPQIDTNTIDEKLNFKMQDVRDLIEKGHAIRKKLNIRVRQPLSTIYLSGYPSSEQKIWQKFENLITKELNVKNISYTFYEKIKNDKNIFEI